MRVSNFDGTKKIGIPSELPEASDVPRTPPSNNAHNLTTVQKYNVRVPTKRQLYFLTGCLTVLEVEKMSSSQ